MTSIQTTDGLTYICAGFWLRLAAYIIDGVVLCVLNLPILIFAVIKLAALDGHDPDGSAACMTLGAAIWISSLLNLGYYTLFECTKQATPGKICFGLIVTGNNAKKLSFAQALVRNLCKYISTLLLGFGYLMAAFTAQKQALHDKMSGCYVLQQHHLKETDWSPTHQKHGTSWNDVTPQSNASADLTGLNRPTDSNKKATSMQSNHVQIAGTAYGAVAPSTAVSMAEPPAIKIPDTAVSMPEPPAISIPDPAVSMAEPPAISIPDPAVSVTLPSAVKIADPIAPTPVPSSIASASPKAAFEPCRKCGADLDPNFSFCLSCSQPR